MTRARSSPSRVSGSALALAPPFALALAPPFALAFAPQVALASRVAFALRLALALPVALLSGAGPLSARAWADGSPPAVDEPVAWVALPPPAAPPVADPATAARGRALYLDRCAPCHGRAGDGDGPTASYLTPRPRDFTRATFKVRSTPSGELPTADDLLATLGRGLHGSSMPSWSGLPVDDRRLLVQQVQSFSPRFRDQPPTRTLVLPDPPPAPTRARVDAGVALYLRAGCPQCHGPDGRGDGPATATLRDDLGRKDAPPSLLHGEAFRGGCGPRALYRTLATGLDGTPMPSYAAVLGQDALLNLVAYLRAHLADPTPCPD